MRQTLRTLIRRERHSSKSSRPTTRTRSSNRRRLICESLESRWLLSMSSPMIELLDASPALFVENQGQWADESARFVHQGNGVNVAMTDAGPVFEAFRYEPTSDGVEPDEDEPGLGRP